MTYLPIADYAVIGDGITAALVSREGSIDWLCLPLFDSPAVLCRLLDARKGGFFRVRPVAEGRAIRAYVEDTNVLATTWTTDSGAIRVTDFMAVTDLLPRTREREPFRLCRLVEGLAGRVEVELALKATFDFATESALIEIDGSGAVARGAGGPALHVRWPFAVRASGDEILGRASVSQGERVWITFSDRPFEDDPEQLLSLAKSVWREWISRCEYRGPDDQIVRRSALALKLLTFRPSGAILAAPTTSLPEEIGGVRNWDYRFTWLRDAAFSLNALMAIGYHDEALAFWKWIERAGKDARIGVVHRIDGSTDLPERLLEHLEGYRGSRPVRVGNSAVEQDQLDVLGEVLDAAHLCHSTMRNAVDPGLAPILARLADRAAESWREPDHGIWEFRDAPRHYVHSKVMAWVALDRASRLVESGLLTGKGSAHWDEEAREIRKAVCEQGFDRELGAFVQAFDRRVPDASALVLPLVGFLPATDPRVLSTLRVVEEHLGVDDLIYRYRAEDGIPGTEGAFFLATFWRIENLILAGRTDEARGAFDHVLSYANDLGLFSEEVDPASRALLGNFPQAFTHLALVRSAARLAEAEHQIGRAGAPPSPT